VLGNAEFVNEIVWSGEASFKLSCTVERQLPFTGPLERSTFVADEAVNLPGSRCGVGHAVVQWLRYCATNPKVAGAASVV
jgi:hypothetical protein